MTMQKLSWPAGWTPASFNRALLALRQHRLPDFAMDAKLSPDTVRGVLAEVETLSEKAGYYIFDSRPQPEPWRSAPYVPQPALASVERVFVRDFTDTSRVLALSAAGQDEELLLTRACRDCGDIITVTIGMAATAIRKFKLADEGKSYRPPWRCRTCKRQRRQDNGRRELKVPIGERIGGK